MGAITQARRHSHVISTKSGSVSLTGVSTPATKAITSRMSAALALCKKLESAFTLFRASADQGFADALNDLGFIYYQGGLNVTPDQNLGLEYFQRAADVRHPQAMFNVAALIDDGVIPGRTFKDAAEYLYRSLRTGSKDVYELLRDRPAMFKIETRKELQRKLSQYAFYQGTIDGDFGSNTQRGIRAAYGLSE